MSPLLKHPKTGRTVSVTNKQSGFYTDHGWVATEPDPTEAEAAEAAKKEAADKEAADLAAKLEAEAADAAAKDAESKKEPADGTETGSGKPTARKVAKTD